MLLKEHNNAAYEGEKRGKEKGAKLTWFTTDRLCLRTCNPACAREGKKKKGKRLNSAKSLMKGEKDISPLPVETGCRTIN